jgi:hypothetical protein
VTSVEGSGGKSMQLFNSWRAAYAACGTNYLHWFPAVCMGILRNSRYYIRCQISVRTFNLQSTGIVVVILAGRFAAAGKMDSVFTLIVTDMNTHTLK